MRRLLLPILFFPIVFAACKQEDDDNPEPVTTTAEISVAGVAPVEIEQNSVTYLTLTVSATGGSPNTTLSVTDLPPGVSGYINQSSSQPPFSAELVLQAASNAVPGTVDTATVTATPRGSNAVAKSYQLPIRIKSCTGKYTGSFNVVQNCGFSGGGTTVFTSTITADSVFPTRVRINNFKNSGVTIFAEVNCSSGFNIPLQAPPGANFTVDGSGSLNGSTLMLNYSTTQIGSTSAVYCNASYTR